MAYQKAVDEEFDNEQPALISLMRSRISSQNPSRLEPNIILRRLLKRNGLHECRLQFVSLLVVLRGKDQSCHKGTEDLGEDVAGDLLQREALPEGEADCDGGVEVAAGGGGAGDDSEGDSHPVGETDCEDGAEGWLGMFGCECSSSSDAGIHLVLIRFVLMKKQ